MSLRAFGRPLAKAITIGNINNDLIDLFVRGYQMKPGQTPASVRADFDKLRPFFAEILIKHLDAYDQRES